MNLVSGFAGEPGSISGVIPPLLRDNRNFRNYFFGQAVSLLGDQITLIALPLTAVLALHATAGQMGALTTVALVPNLIFSLHAGSWVDRRGGRRQVMLVADVLPRHPDRDGSRGLRARPPDLGAALRGRVRLRCTLGLLLRRVRRLLPDDRRARGLRRRQLAGARQPRLLVPRRHEHRRNPRSARAWPVRARDRRGVVPLVGAVPRPDQRGRPAGRPGEHRRHHGRGTLDPQQRDHPRRAAGHCDPQLLQLHLLRPVPALSRRGSCTSSRRHSAWSSAPPPSGRCSAR